MHFQRALCGVGLHRHADRAVQDTVQDVERLPLQTQPVGIGDIVDAAAKDVVFRHDFFDVESILDTLEPVGRRARMDCLTTSMCLRADEVARQIEKLGERALALAEGRCESGAQSAPVFSIARPNTSNPT
jgi:hypothetical protein